MSVLSLGDCPDALQFRCGFLLYCFWNLFLSFRNKIGLYLDFCLINSGNSFFLKVVFFFLLDFHKFVHFN